MRFIFLAEPACHFILADSAIMELNRYRQKESQQPESGGVLLGRHLLDSMDIVVDEVSPPQPRDKRSRFRFFRSRQHDEYAKRRWKEAGTKIAYLGLWHSHPEDYPVPSEVDLLDWANAVKRNHFEGDRLFFLIIGISQICVWTKERTGSLLELKLTRVIDDEIYTSQEGNQ